MNKQAIMRHLDRQELADLLIAYVYGGARDKAEEKRQADVDKRMQEASIDVQEDFILIKGEGEEACHWVDTLIGMDNQKGAAEKKRLAAEKARDLAILELKEAQREEAIVRHMDGMQSEVKETHHDDSESASESSDSATEVADASIADPIDPGDESPPAPSPKRKRRP